MRDPEKFPAKAKQVFDSSFEPAHKRYMDLMGRCESLTPEECEEFADLMNEFEDNEALRARCVPIILDPCVVKQTQPQEPARFSTNRQVPEILKRLVCPGTV
jgi:hypothetical protein